MALQVPRSSNKKDLLKMKYVLNCMIEFERFIRRVPVQCKNWQRYGHSATNSGMSYHCVKCGERHCPKKCLVPARSDSNNDRSVLKCANYCVVV